MLSKQHNNLLEQQEGAQASHKKGTRMITLIRPLLKSWKVPVWSLGDRLPRTYYQLWRDRHGIRPHINHRRLAYAQVYPRCSSASRLHKLLPTIHPQIRQRNCTNFWLTKEMEKQIGMDPKGRARIPEAQQGIYRHTNLPAFRPGKPNHPPNRYKWLHNDRYSQPVPRFRHSQTSQLLLAKTLSCRTELWHVRSGAIGHRGHLEAMAALSRGSQS